MPGAVRVEDMCSGHDGFQPVANMSMCNTVEINNSKVVGYGSRRQIHCNGVRCHSGVNVGIHSVFVNDAMCQAGGDPVDCGSTQVGCSANVFIN